MAYDQNDSVESTLAEILAELDLAPSPAAAVSEPAQEAPKKEEPAPAPAPAAPAPQAPIKSTQTSLKMPAESPAFEKRPASEGKAAPPEGPDSEEGEDEPPTMVFRPMDLKGRMRVSTVSAASAAPSRPSSRPTASLKEELEQLARSGGTHSLTAQLRARDASSETSGSQVKSRRAPAARAGKTAPVQKAAPQEDTVVSTQAEPAKKPRLTGWKRELFEWGRALVIAFGVVFLIFFVLLKIVYVDGSSMNPTLQEGDRLIISGLFYTPENGDIVVTSAKNGLKKPLVKRVIAVGGQTVDLDESGRVLVNGLLLEEDYLADGAFTAPDGLTLPLTVPEGCLFLMGDNREHSTDSRNGLVGLIPQEEIQGRVLFRFFPFVRFGTVK